MKGEIDKDFYCSAYCHDPVDKQCRKGHLIQYCEFEDCECYHHKWPTPKQFEEEYEIPYPDDAAVYIGRSENEYYMEWIILSYKVAKMKPRYQYVVCACMPFGCPPDDWRPE